MDHLWSPWRLAYVTRTGGQAGCVFCEALAEEEASLVVFSGVTCYIILNKFPYNNGHLMVVPNRHVASLGEATGDELCELIELARRAEVAVREAYAPHGLNMGINLASRPAPGFSTTCTCTSFRAGTGTPTS